QIARLQDLVQAHEKDQVQSRHRQDNSAEAAKQARELSPPENEPTQFTEHPSHTWHAKDQRTEQPRAHVPEHRLVPGDALVGSIGQVEVSNRTVFVLFKSGALAASGKKEWCLLTPFLFPNQQAAVRDLHQFLADQKRGHYLRSHTRVAQD